jgi:LuxR family maltose regulon positive regulatory protein
VHRPRISVVLDGNEDVALTLVAAPAGYGKTTAVLEWCSNRPAAIVWVTLDARDNDPVRLWTYMGHALDRVRDGLGRGALWRLQTSSTIKDVIDELAGALSRSGSELVLVFDDLHTVTDPGCLASIQYLVSRLPATTRLIAMTRSDPMLGLARLRARGQLVELRANELAFTADEARELLGGIGRLDLSTREIDGLIERTEGWPAALVLAALWLRSVDEPHEAVREFGGNHRFVADFLSHEALASLPREVRSFVLGISVLGRFTAELCDAVLARTDSASLLDELERSDFFVTRLEARGWYRVHGLFAEFACFQLEAEAPGATIETHRRASTWLQEHGLAAEAVEQAAAAGDHETVAELLVREHELLVGRHLPQLGNGGARALVASVRALPDEQLLAHPELASVAALATTVLGGATLERTRLLALVSRARVERSDRFTPYAGAVAAVVRTASLGGDVSKAVAVGRRAVKLAGSLADDVLAAAFGSYARALYFAGRLDEARDAALRAVGHPESTRRAPGQAMARATLALVAVDHEQHASARIHAERAKAIVAAAGTSRSWLGGYAAAALGLVLAAEDKLPEAERELAFAERFFRDEVATVDHAWLLVLLARVRVRRGRLDGAKVALAEARAAMRELADSGRVAAMAADVAREANEAEQRAAGGDVLERPSEAELAVLDLLATDLSAPQIATALFLSPNTVRSHTRSIYRKLGVNSRTDAVARAGALGVKASSPM